MGVSRLIGKLFGGDADRNAAVLRAYGKLPFYAEYRRLELAPGTPTVFSQWLDAGRLAWVRNPERTDASHTRPSRVLIGLPDAKEAVVASIWPSRDNLGREFPFAFFVTCPLDALGTDPVERWVAAGVIHETFATLHKEVHALGSGGDFYRAFRKRAVTLRADDLEDRVRNLRTEAATIPATTWFDGLRLGRETSFEAWFDGLARRATRWRNRPEALRQSALACPLAPGYSCDVQAVLYLEWLARLLGTLDRSPWLIAPTQCGPSAPTLSLILRDLLPDDYQLLTTEDRNYGYIEHLWSLAKPAAGEPSAPPTAPPSNGLLTWLKQHAP